MPRKLPAETTPEKLLAFQRTLGAFARIASEAMPRERLMHHATALVSGAMDVRRVKVLRYRADHGDLLIEAGVGWKPGVVGKATLPIDKGSPPGRSLQTGQPVVIEDITESPEFRLSPLLAEHGIVSLANVPVPFDGKVWGVFEVDAETPRPFDDADLGFLEAFANVLGMALQRQETDEKLLELNADCARREAQGDVLLRELQHRIKNNFQVIISFLSLQRRQVSDPEIRDRFGSVMDRVHAIALAHDQLSTKQSTSSNVAFGDYLRALCANIDPHRDGITVEVQAEDATMTLDRAVPVGLIVNELVTNSLKYAFDEAGGLIRVSFQTQPDRGEGSLAVEDNGKGMAGRRSGGLGLTLVDAFARQLGGEVATDPVDRGTRIRVRFPLPL